jgi:hypothetical protein
LRGLEIRHWATLAQDPEEKVKLYQFVLLLLNSLFGHSLGASVSNA